MVDPRQRNAAPQPPSRSSVLFIQLLLLLSSVTIISLLFFLPRALPRTQSGFVSQHFSNILEGDDMDSSDSEARYLPDTRPLPGTVDLNSAASSCSCYRIPNPLCVPAAAPGGCQQLLCACSMLCWNGSELVTLRRGASDPDFCLARPDDVEEGGPLQALGCAEKVGIDSPIEIIAHEGHIRAVRSRGPEWLSTRQQVVWKPGRSFVQTLDVSGENAAKFALKLFPLLLLNNATGPAFMPRVDRFVIPRDAFFRSLTREKGAHAFHAVLLELLLGAAVEAAFGRELRIGVREWDRKRMVDDEREGRRGVGRVEFESSWSAATEDAPVCFEEAVLGGSLKGMLYPGGVQQRDVFWRFVRQRLGLKGAANVGRLGKQLLLIRRTDAQSRALTEPSRRQLVETMHKKGFVVREVEMGKLSLQEQVEAVLWADVVVAVHGAGLTSVAAFAQHGVVVLEIMPYHLYSNQFETMMLSAGLFYLQHQGHAGQLDGEGRSESLLALDAKFGKTSLTGCFSDPACRRYFARDRPVLLTQEDFSQLEVLLHWAKEIAAEVARVGPEEAELIVKARLSDKCVKEVVDLGLCRQDYLRLPNGRADRACVLNRDCRSSS